MHDHKPPTTGAAVRAETSAPTPPSHSRGKRPSTVVMFNAFEYVEIYGIEDERIAIYKQKGIDLLDQLIIEHAQARDAGRKAQSEEPG